MRKIALTGIMVAIVLGLTSCGGPTVKELQAENESLMADIADNEEKIAELESVVKIINGDDVSITGITNVEDGSGAKTFNSVGGKILFDGVLEYEGSTQAPNTASINLAERVSIVPTNNWVVKIEGTTTKLSHPDGLYGTFKVSTIDEIKKSDYIDENMLTPFLDTVPNTGIVKSRIYVEDSPRGMMADVTTLNNSKPAMIKCGLVANGDKALVFTFYYDGDKDSTKDETINSILKSIKFGARSIRIE